MSSSPAEGGEPAALRALADLDEVYAGAARALAAGDLVATAEAVARADTLLAGVDRRTCATPPAATLLAGVRERHSRLLAAAAGARDRLASELTKIRGAQRALRSYGWRRPVDDGRTA